MTVSIEEKVLLELKNQNRGIRGLSNEVSVSERHLYYVLMGKGEEKRRLYPSLLARINDALGTDFSLSDQQTSEGRPAADSPTK